MGQKKRKEKPVPTLDVAFNADVAPMYDEEKPNRFNTQGKLSFMDEWHTLYRRWVKNE
jgi:hypothetical protein